MEIKIGSNSIVRAIDYDSKLCLTLGAGGITIPLVALPSFEVDIFVENRESENVECSFDGTTKTNCTITDAGAVTCYIPSGSYSVSGKLYMKLTTYNPNENFSDGTCDDIIIVDTEYRME